MLAVMSFGDDGGGDSGDEFLMNDSDEWCL